MYTATLFRLNGKSVVSLKAKVPILGNTSDTTWVQMAYEGTFAGHAQGPFAFDKKTFSEIINKFKRTTQPIVITYGHPQGDAAPAAGFIIDLEMRQGKSGLELYGLCEFTKKAAMSIRDGEFKFCSVVVDFNSLDRVSGKAIGTEMYQLGLTNNPFMEGMAPIALSKVTQKELSMAKKSDKVVEPVVDPSVDPAVDSNLKEPIAPVECVKCAKTPCACKMAVGDVVEPAIDESETPAETDQEVKSPEMECVEVCDILSKATGLDIPTLAVAIKNNLDQVSAVINKTATAASALEALEATPAPSLSPVALPILPMSNTPETLELSIYKSRASELSVELVTLRNQVVELSAYKTAQTALETKARHEASFSRLLSDGKITAAQKELFLSAVNTNEDMAIKLFDGMPSIKPPTEHRVTGLSASPVKAPQGSPVIQDKLDETDPSVKTLRLSARGQGLTGIHADAWIRKALAIKATHSGN